MAVPKRKISKARGRKRRTGNALKPTQLAHCPQCNTAIPTHVICTSCGYYQGRTMTVDED